MYTLQCCVVKQSKGSQWYLIATELHAGEIVPLDEELSVLRRLHWAPLMDWRGQVAQNKSIGGCLRMHRANQPLDLYGMHDVMCAAIRGACTCS